MRRIFYENLVYTQDGNEFNMYFLDPIMKDFMYQLNVCKTDDYHIGCDVNSEKIEVSSTFAILIRKNNLFYPAFSRLLGNKER